MPWPNPCAPLRRCLIAVAAIAGNATSGVRATGDDASTRKRTRRSRAPMAPSRPGKPTADVNASTRAGAAVRNAMKDAVRTRSAKTAVNRKDSDRHAKRPRPRFRAKRDRLKPRSSRPRAITARVEVAVGADDASGLNIGAKLWARRNVPPQAHP